MFFSLLILSKCTKDSSEDSKEETLNFLEINDGKGFVYSVESSDQHIFFYDSDIFLKEVMVVYPSLNSYCSTMKEGANTAGDFNSPDFNAEIVIHEKERLAVQISYIGDDENTVYSLYQYKQDGNNIIVTDDGISTTYYETYITYASLCN